MTRETIMARLVRPPTGLQGLLPVPADELPILYQEEEDEGMSEGFLHRLWSIIIGLCLTEHLAHRAGLQVLSNLNLIYRKKPLKSKIKARPNVAPDVMVVEPFVLLEGNFKSYVIGKNGPAPLLAGEILSEETAEERDLTMKADIYAGLAVPEYVLADPTGKFLSQPLLLKRLRPDHTWEDFCDDDGGITSQLGFRIIVDDDGLPRLIDSATNKRYARPDEAQSEADLRREVEEKCRALEAELQRLRETIQAGKKPKRRPKS
jgi:Uma2 family endonuclease